MNDSALAEILAKHSFEPNGAPSLKRARAACKYVSENVPEGGRLGVLRKYAHIMSVELDRRKVCIEHAGAISAEDIGKLKNFLGVSKQNSPAEIEITENPNLIAGVRLTKGFTVWENSARAQLEDLEKAIGGH